MARTIVSLPLSDDVIKEVSMRAKEQGKNRTEYLRDVIEGHVRMARFHKVQDWAQENWQKDWPKTEEEVVALVREVRKEMAAEKRAKA